MHKNSCHNFHIHRRILELINRREKKQVRIELKPKEPEEKFLFLFFKSVECVEK